MARLFTITTASAVTKVDTKGRGDFSFTVSNIGPRAIRGRAQIVPLGNTKDAWLSLDGEIERDFRLNETQQFTVRLAVPPGSPKGKASFRMDMVSVTNPDEDFTEGPRIDVDILDWETPPAPFPTWLIAIGAVVLLLLAILVWQTIKTPTPEPGPDTKEPEPIAKVQVPNVVGSAYGEAKKKLESHKLKVNYSKQSFTETGRYKPGDVSAQEPAADASVDPESVVDLTLEMDPGDSVLSAVQLSPTNIQVFYPGPNQHLMNKSWNGSQWSEKDLGGTLYSGPSVYVSDAMTEQAAIQGIFYQGKDGHLMQRKFDGAEWGAEFDLGGKMTSAPSALLGINSRTIDVFYRGESNHLMHRQWNGEEWLEEKDLGGELTSAPGPLTPGQNLSRIHYRGRDSALIRRVETTPFTVDVSLTEETVIETPSKLLSAPCVPADTDRILSFAYAGTDRHLIFKIWNAEPQDLGRTVCSAPVLVDGRSAARVYYRNRRQRIVERVMEEGRWSEEKDLGGQVASFVE